MMALFYKSISLLPMFSTEGGWVPMVDIVAVITNSETMIA